MDNPPTTRPSLLLRIRDPQQTEAWAQFVEIYTPLIYRYAVRRGLQDADAADVAQEVFKAVASYVSNFEYNRQRGTFRGYLYTVARNKLNDHLARGHKQEKGSGETRIHQMLDNRPGSDTNDETQWNLDYQRQMFDWAVRQVQRDFQETTWHAFWQTAVELHPAKQVAESLGISVGAVYIAKSRVLTKIKKRIQEILGDESIDHDSL